MSWLTLANNQMVSYTDAQGGGFTLNSGQSAVNSLQCMTKLDALTKYNLNATNMSAYTNSQLVPKSAWINGGWSAANITFNTSRDITSIGVNFTTGGYVYVSPDGTRLYISSYADQKISQYSLSSADNINSTITYVGIGPSLGIYFIGMQFSADGTKVYLTQNGGFIKQYALSTPWTISSMSATVVGTITFPTNDYVRNCSLNRDGTKVLAMYASGSFTVINSALWTLSTPYALSSASALVTANITATMPVVTSTFYLEKLTNHYYCFSGNGTNSVAAYNNGITDADLSSVLSGSSSSIAQGTVCSNDIHIYSLSRNSSPPYVYTLNQYLTNL